MTYLNCKANRKDNMEETIYNLSSDNVYFPSVSYCGFHETFALI